VSFREIKKETFRAQLPPVLAERVRVDMARSNMNYSEYATAAFAAVLGDDPTRYGVEPLPRRRGVPAGA
jgi:hypothetical protein